MCTAATALEAKRHWMPDELCRVCYQCGDPFTFFRRRHHCRLCGQIFCNDCSSHFVSGRIIMEAGSVRSCDECYQMLTHGQNRQPEEAVTAAPEDGGGTSSINTKLKKARELKAQAAAAATAPNGGTGSRKADEETADDGASKAEASSSSSSAPAAAVKLRYGKGASSSEPKGGFVPCCESTTSGGGGLSFAPTTAAATATSSSGATTTTAAKGEGSDAQNERGVAANGASGGQQGQAAGSSGGGSSGDKAVTKNQSDKKSKVPSMFGSSPWHELANQELYAKVSEMMYSPFEGGGALAEDGSDAGTRRGPPVHPQWAHLWKNKETEASKVFDEYFAPKYPY